VQPSAGACYSAPGESVKEKGKAGAERGLCPIYPKNEHKMVQETLSF
jgi:hypothetical protein